MSENMMNRDSEYNGYEHDLVKALYEVLRYNTWNSNWLIQWSNITKLSYSEIDWWLIMFIILICKFELFF